VDTLTKEFDQLLCMNKVSNAFSMQDVCLICASPLHTSIDCPCIGKSDFVIEQVHAAKDFIQQSLF